MDPAPSLGMIHAMNSVRRLLATARAAAREAFQLVVRRTRSGRPVARRKGEGDFVTAIDVAVERLLRRRLLAAHPTHGFVGEETSPVRPDAEHLWIVDPIDGTSNFARGLGPYAVAVACLRDRTPVAAAMVCAPGNEFYSAGRGLGAWCGNRPLRIRGRQLDDASVIGVQWLRGPRSLWYLPRLLDTGTRIRNFGCSVGMLCDVAQNRLDANLQEQGRIWDIAAPALVVLEAGGRFTDWSGKPIFPLAERDFERHYPSMAASPATLRSLLRALNVSNP
jgi:myo-inositol-1(or 4)-monophosphatase